MTHAPLTPALSLAEVAARCGVETTFVQQLLELGIIEGQLAEGTRFSREVTLRVHRCARLQRDLGVNLEGAAVILQLLDQVEALERQLLALRR